MSDVFFAVCASLDARAGERLELFRPLQADDPLDYAAMPVSTFDASAMARVVRINC